MWKSGEIVDARYSIEIKEFLTDNMQYGNTGVKINAFVLYGLHLLVHISLMDM